MTTTLCYRRWRWTGEQAVPSGGSSEVGKQINVWKEKIDKDYVGT